MSTEIRQAVIERPHLVELRSVETPEPGPGELRVRSSAVGICGSDLHALAGSHPWIELPVVPGHEVAGIVEAVGEGVTAFAEGDRVLLEPSLVCGECIHCRSGRYNVCERLRVVGCQTDGALADAFIAPADRFHPVPSQMGMQEAALVEPLAVATHAVRVGGVLAESVVAVLGAGSIGQLVVVAAKAAGAVAVAVTDPLEWKRERALTLGADAAYAPDEDDVVDRIRSDFPRRPDVVLDCVSSEGSVDQALRLAANGGTAVVVGVPHGRATVDLALLQDRELRMQGSATYLREDVERAIELLAADRVGVGQVVTATLPLTEAPRAFEAARSGDELKVHVLCD